MCEFNKILFYINMENDRCVICYDAFKKKDIRFLPCSHKFHDECVSQWLVNHDKCPICRISIHVNHVDEDGNLVNSWNNFRPPPLNLDREFMRTPANNEFNSIFDNFSQNNRNFLRDVGIAITTNFLQSVINRVPMEQKTIPSHPPPLVRQTAESHNNSRHANFLQLLEEVREASDGLPEFTPDETNLLQTVLNDMDYPERDELENQHDPIFGNLFDEN